MVVDQAGKIQCITIKMAHMEEEGWNVVAEVEVVVMVIQVVVVPHQGTDLIILGAMVMEVIMVVVEEITTEVVMVVEKEVQVLLREGEEKVMDGGTIMGV